MEWFAVDTDTMRSRRVLTGFLVVASVCATLVTTGPGRAEAGATVQQRVYVSNRTTSGVADHTFVFGDPTGTLITGDWNGNGRDGFASRRGNELTLVDSHGRAQATVRFGVAGDELYVGDWDGDGTDTFAVRRGKIFHVTNSASATGATFTIGYGKIGDEVFVGDWDGDGIDTFAVRRRNVFHVRNSVTSGPADVVFGYGKAGDEVLVGDWDTDGIDTFAVRRGNIIFIRNDFRTGVAEHTLGYGRASDHLVVGDWDGDGVDTFAVRRTEPVPAPPVGGACGFAPPDSYWTADVRGLPVHSRSAAYVANIGLDRVVHPDFGSGTYAGGPIGIPYVDVAGSQPKVGVSFRYSSESDPGPYPIPANPPIEGGPSSSGDRHVLVRDTSNCVLYELFDAHPNANGTWQAGSGAVFDLRSNDLRPAGWTSADAAGLPVLPGLVRYDEVAAGRIDHAVRITVPRSDRSYVWPARHQAGAADDANLPPMGLWLRLKSTADLSGLDPQARIVAEAMQKHGVIVSDNGSPWFLSGTPDPRWDNDDLRTLRTLHGSDFEALDPSSLIVDPNSGAIR